MVNLLLLCLVNKQEGWFNYFSEENDEENLGGKEFVE